MELVDYIADAKRRDRLAEDVPTSPQYLWQLAHRWRDKRPSPLMAKAIDRATGGQVPKETLRPDIWPPEDGKPQQEVA